VYERRRLARLLYQRVQVDQPIPPELFIDVARIYAELGESRRNRLSYGVTQ